MPEAVIVEARRTPIGTLSGSLKSLSAAQMGALVIQALLERTGIDPGQVDEVLMGNVLGAGAGQNVARQAAIGGGLPFEVPATSVNKVCGSGLKAVALAAQAIRAGDAEMIIAGGTESMSGAPYLLPRAREGFRFGDISAQDSIMQDGLRCAFLQVPMGITAENVAERFGITREQQDAFALASQEKTRRAMEEGAFRREMVEVRLPGKRGDVQVVEQDQHPRPQTTAESLARLKPAFKEGGTVTAGNASGINDGAAALLVMSAEKAEKLGLNPLATIRGYASGGVDPALMGLGPIPATRRLLERNGLKISDFDLFELNEAFASQSLAVLQELSLPTDLVNIRGGAIALGHPIGASGARILVTLLHAMAEKGVRRGLASLCIGGGQGIALAVETLNN